MYSVKAAAGAAVVVDEDCHNFRAGALSCLGDVCTVLRHRCEPFVADIFDMCASLC
jgi:hypothetical protein